MGFKMIGYGKFQYVARNGQYMDWPVVGVALQKNYISVYLSVTKDGASLIQLYSGKLGQLRVRRKHFSFRTYEDLDVRLLASLFAEAEQIFQSDPRHCNLAHGGNAEEDDRAQNRLDVALLSGISFDTTICLSHDLRRSCAIIDSESPVMGSELETPGSRDCAEQPKFRLARLLRKCRNKKYQAEPA